MTDPSSSSAPSVFITPQPVVASAQWNPGNTSLAAIIDQVEYHSIPTDPANREYAAILKWVTSGNTILPAPNPTAAELEQYVQTVWQNLLAKGQIFNVSSDGAPPVNILCDGSNNTRADLALLALYGQVYPTGTKTWLDNNGVTTTLTGAQLVNLATLAGNWVSNTYPALVQLLGQIASSPPTITSKPQIDAFVWPTS